MFKTDSCALHTGPSDANSPSAGSQSDDDDELVIMDGPAANQGHEDDDIVIIGEPKVPQAAELGTHAQAEGGLSKRPAEKDLHGPRKRQRGT